MCIRRIRNSASDVAMIIIIEITIVALFFFFQKEINGNDFWWHVKVGEWIVENGRIPTQDIFSWISQEYDLPWVAHEWLSEVIFYKIYHFFGERGIYILSLGCASGLLVLIYKEIKEHFRRNVLIGGLFYALFSVIARIFCYGRPHMFSFILLFVELKILYSFYKNPDKNTIFLLPVISCLWSNLHGGSSNLSYLLCLLFLGSSVLEFQCGKIYAVRIEKKQMMKLMLVTFLTVLGILINPIGVKIITYPYINMGDTLMMSVIGEWRAPDAKDMGNLVVFFLPIVLMTFGFLTEKDKLRFVDVMVMGSFLLLFFRSVRFIILWYLAAVFCACPYIPELNVKEIKKKYEKIIVHAVSFILGIVIIVFGYRVLETTYKGDIITKAVSDEMISVIQKDDSQKIFNDYNAGETLIFHEIPVFFDSRADVYATKNILADGVSLLYLEQLNEESEKCYVDVNELLDKYEFESILVLNSRPLYSYLMSHPDQFAMVYEDSEYAYFQIM